MSVGAKPERPILTVSFYVQGFEIVATGTDESRLEEVCAAICSDMGEPFDGKPTVILLETIRKPAEAEGKYIRQTGGLGNYGHVKLRLEPLGEGQGFEFVNEVPEAILPGPYAAATEKGIREAARTGVLCGYQMVAVKATLFDGSYHEIDSNPMAFQIAAAMAFKEAAKMASPILLEPMMSVELMADLAIVGEIVSDLNARRGRIESMDPYAGFLEITALVPLREMLRSSKYGRPDYSMEFARYEATRLPRDGFDEGGIGVTADLPNAPHLGRSSAAVQPDIDFDS